MANIGPMELVIVLVVALLILGPKRLPQAGVRAWDARVQGLAHGLVRRRGRRAQGRRARELDLDRHALALGVAQAGDRPRHGVGRDGACRGSSTATRPP